MSCDKKREFFFDDDASSTPSWLFLTGVCIHDGHCGSYKEGSYESSSGACS